MYKNRWKFSKTKENSWDWDEFNGFFQIFLWVLDESIEPLDLSIDLLSYFNQYNDFSFKDSFFDTLYGKSDLRLSISNSDNIDKIFTGIKQDVIKFKEFRKDYLIYKQKHKQWT